MLCLNLFNSLRSQSHLFDLHAIAVFPLINLLLIRYPPPETLGDFLENINMLLSIFLIDVTSTYLTSSSSFSCTFLLPNIQQLQEMSISSPSPAVDIRKPIPWPPACLLKTVCHLLGFLRLTLLLLLLCPNYLSRFTPIILVYKHFLLGSTLK